MTQQSINFSLQELYFHNLVSDNSTAYEIL